MRAQYIKQVEKALHLPRRAKKEVIRDLNEIFASALENGESEQQVAARLGAPHEFAQNASEQLGAAFAASEKQNWILLGAAALAIAAFILYGAIRADMAAPGIIGQAEAMTTIQIAGGGNLSLIFLVIGIAAAVFTAVGMLRAIHKKRRY